METIETKEDATRLVIPEGVTLIERGAFRGRRQLVEVVLPETLEEIEDLAFSYTGITSIRLPKSCVRLSRDALRTGPEVVPGVDRRYRGQLASIEVDPDNPVFTMAGPVLCRRIGSESDGLEAILCPARVDVVDLTERVSRIAATTFEGTVSIRELRVRESVELDAGEALLPNGSCDRLTILLDDGTLSLEMPACSARIRILDACPKGCVDARAIAASYDDELPEIEDKLERARLMLARLQNPLLLGGAVRERFADMLEGELDQLLAHFGARGMWGELDALFDVGLLGPANLSHAIDVLSALSDSASVAHLLAHTRPAGNQDRPHPVDQLTAYSLSQVKRAFGEQSYGRRAIEGRSPGGEHLDARSRNNLLNQTNQLAIDVVDSVRGSLMGALRFLDVALWRMPLASKPIERAVATDGYLFYLDPVRVIRTYRDDLNEVARDYLHAVLHCVFRHPFEEAKPNLKLWDLACDISVEACALELVGLRFPSARDAERLRALGKLKESCPKLTAPKVYAALAAALVEAQQGVSAKPHVLSKRFIESLPELFARDDHAVWTRGKEKPTAQLMFDDDVVIIDSVDERLRGERAEEVELDEQSAKPGVNMPGAPAPSGGGAAAEGEVEGGDRFIDADAFEEGEESFQSMLGVRVDDFDNVTWTDISKMIEVELEAYLGKPGVDAGTFEVNLKVSNRKTYDYREFLRRFSALSEEMKVSTEEFDYVYYTYGLSRYGNMPLVEPLEYQDSRRVRDFVIAIDTSASCAGGLVKHFIEKTYDVLRSQMAFGRKVNVHIVQCDCDVRKDTKITSVRDLDDDFGEFVARGFGGTDFRPVFSYIDELVASREFTNLKGMIYLTDGIGTYPEEAPDYECAFVFVNDDGAKRAVPAWATKVMMTEDEIMEL